MIWKKNAVSCLMWMVYLLMVGTAMVFTCRAVCESFGMAQYFEFVIPAVYLLFTGILVFALHRMAVKLDVGAMSAGKGLAKLERILVFVLFAVGLFLRMAELQPERLAESEGSIYLNLAYVSAGSQAIPRSSHGIVYLYVCLLRLCFILLGNKAATAVWLQIVLQMLGVLLLYTAVRKMAGRISAVTMVSFFMLSPYMVGKALSLSPEILYLLLFSLVLSFISQGVQFVPGWGFWLVAGVMSAVLCCLDVAGFLLLPLVSGVVVMRRQDVERKIFRGAFGSLAGFLLGTAGCVLADVLGSGKSVSGVIRAWMDLYQWGDLQLSITISGFDVIWLIVLILCFMAWGVFSFWCGRSMERFSAWIFCLCMAVLLQFLGIFTEEMNGFGYIFLLSTVLAGLGIRECMTVYSPERETAGNKGEAEKAGDMAIMAEEEGGHAKAIEYNAKAEEMSKEEGVKAEEKSKEEGVKEKKMSETEGMEAGEMSEENMGAEKTAEEKEAEEKEAEAERQPDQERKIEFLENPLPLPKKHEKRVMDYKLNSDRDLGGYDVYVADDDDFDH